MSDYAWFIEPLDQNTNSAVTQLLQELPEVVSLDNSFMPQTLCQDGQRHNLWRCPFEVVTAMRKNKLQMNLKFNVFNRHMGGQIREAKFLKRKRRHVAPKRP